MIYPARYIKFGIYEVNFFTPPSVDDTTFKYDDFWLFDTQAG